MKRPRTKALLLLLISAFQLFSISAFCAPASITGNNIKLTNVPVEGTAASVARLLALDATGLGESVTPAVLWDAIVLSGVNTADVTGLDTALAGLQPLDADLTAIAGLTTTAWGRGFLDDANAAATRAALSLGNVEDTALSTWAGSSAITTLGTVTSGTFAGTLGAISGAALTSLNGSNISSGTVALARLPATAGGGAALDSGYLPTYGNAGELTATESLTLSNPSLTGSAALSAGNITAAARLLYLPDSNGTLATQEWVSSGYVGKALSTSQGALIYRGASDWVALGPGTAGQVLQSGGAGADPSWAAAGSGSPGGSDTQLQYHDSGAFGGNAGLTVSKTTGAVTQLQTSLGTTPAAGITLTNTTAAAAGAQQVSPATVWTGQGWKTTATAASQQVDFRAYTLPVQGSSAPTGTWALQSQIAGGGWTDRMTVTSGGNLTIGTVTASANITASGNLVLGGDLTLARAAAATLRLGTSDTAAPTAQVLRVQSVSSGTSNTAGANFTIQGSRSTGTGAGGDIIFQASAPGSSGTAQNALATIVTIKGDAAKCTIFAGPVTLPAYTVATLPAAASYPYAKCFVSDANATLAAGIGTTVAGGGSNKVPVFSDGTNWIIGG